MRRRIREQIKQLFAIAMLTLITPFQVIGQAHGKTHVTEIRQRIGVFPSSALIDEKVSIRLDGFRPNQRVIVRARMKDDSNRSWASNAEFLTDKHGAVNLDSAKPLSGTYSETDPNGLFWSINLAPDEKQVSPFSKQTLSPTNHQLHRRS